MDGHRTGAGNGPGNRTPPIGRLTVAPTRRRVRVRVSPCCQAGERWSGARDVVASWSVLDEEHAAVEDVVVDELEVGRRYVGEGRLAAVGPGEEWKGHEPQPVHQPGADELASDGDAAHGSERDLRRRLQPSDLLGQVVPAYPRVGPVRSFERVAEDNRFKLGHLLPAAVAMLLG